MKSIKSLKQCTMFTISTILPTTLSLTGAQLGLRSSLGLVGTKITKTRNLHSYSTPSSSRALNRQCQHLLTSTHTFKAHLSPVLTPYRQMSHSSCAGPFGDDLIFRQLLEYKSYTYTYLLADVKTNEAVIIDPVLETVDRDVKIVHELGLKLVYAANTHVHADHITGSGSLKKLIPTCKSVIAEVSKARGDVKIKEGDLIKFGKFQLEARSTPGHTDGCMTFVLHEKGLVFTGDALLIRGCGRTDFQQGSPGALYDSIHKKILSLPQSYFVLPAHDYTGQTMSTVGEELRYNPRLTKPKNEFIEIMNKLNLPYPKQIDKALPANMVCGVFDVPESS